MNSPPGFVTLSREELKRLIDDAVTDKLSKTKRRKEEHNYSDDDDDDDDGDFKPVPIAEVMIALENYKMRKDGYGMTADFEAIGKSSQFLKNDLWYLFSFKHND